MRAFIAITLTPDIKERLSRIQTNLKECGADIRWVLPENMHLTLRFLGEINEIMLNGIIRVTEETAHNHSKFEIGLSGIGTFPDIDHPKVIWVGVKDGDKKIEDLAYALEKGMEALEIIQEKKPFSCHITLGRTRSPKNMEKLMAAVNNLGEDLYKEGTSFTAERITVFKSRLTPGGAVYEALKEITLRDT